MTERWQKLDKFVALQAESYWAELTKLSHNYKADLLASLAQSNSTRYRIAESTLSFDEAMRTVLSTAQHSEYEQSMRRLFYESLSGQELNDAAADEVERMYLIGPLLTAKLSYNFQL
jgi:hypothetical protein